MFLERTMHAKTKKAKKIKYKGPFGMFASRMYHIKNKDIQTRKRLKKLYREALIFRYNWDVLTGEVNEEIKEGDTIDFNALEGRKKPKKVSDCILSYFVFKKIPDESRRELIELYQKRYDVELVDGFSKQYIQKRPGFIKKTAFIVWMNYYLRNEVSLEILELDSFELALKLGDVWNKLPIEEKAQWQLMVDGEMRRHHRGDR